MTREDELQLIQATAEGDRQAFQQLYETTWPMVSRYVKRLINDETLAEDVLVQTYTIAWQKASDFRGAGRLTTWLIGIARNVAFKEFRKNKDAIPFDESYQMADNQSQNKPEIQDRNRRMQDALAVLSPSHREILELVFYQDLSYPEISALIDIPVNTVKTRVFHAKKAFKTELEKLDITSHDY